METQPNLPLRSANANQLTVDGIKQDWSIRKNGSEGERIHSFVPNISDSLMFDILNFARKFEREAYDKGLLAGTDSSSAALLQQIANLRDKLSAVEAHNEFLAQTLEDSTHGIN